jgi:hypothetical protein
VLLDVFRLFDEEEEKEGDMVHPNGNEFDPIWAIPLAHVSLSGVTCLYLSNISTITQPTYMEESGGLVSCKRRWLVSIQTKIIHNNIFLGDAK